MGDPGPATADRSPQGPAVAAVRSYKRRGRLGPVASRSLATLLPGHDGVEGLPRGGRPFVVEIGFGTGDATVECALAAPDIDLLAVDVHRPGVAGLLRLVDQAGLANVRVVLGDAVEVLAALPARSVTEVRLWFPDPWPKTRHAKRRFVQPATATLLGSRLVPAGRLHLASDSRCYVEYARRALEPLFDTAVVDRPAWRPVTRFEARARAAGRPSYDVLAVLRP